MYFLPKLLLNLIVIIFNKMKAHPIVVGIILLTITLGMIGFSSVFPEFSTLTKLYMTMQLFLVDSQSFDVSDVISEDGQVSLPWTLEWARWMAAALTFSGILLGAWKILRKSTDNVKIEELSNHLIIFGSGEVVESVLEEADKGDTPCVLVSSCEELVKHRLEQKNLTVKISVKGNENPTLEAKHLELAGLSRASNFYALHSNDSENLRAALLIRNMKRNADMKIIVRQDEPISCDLLQRNGLLSTDRDANGLRIISIDKTRARMLLKKYPLEWHDKYGQATKVHLAIPKLDSFTKAIVIQTAMVGHYKDGKKVNLWLDSENDLSEIEQDYPGIKKCLNFDFLEGKSPGSVPEIFQENTGSLTTVIMTHVSPEEGYIEALRLHEKFSSENHFRVILRSHLPGNSTDEKLDIGVVPFAEDLLENLEELDRVARQIHEVWYKGNEKRINEERAIGNELKAKELIAKPTYKHWNELTEMQKDENRTAAHHIEVKIRAANLDPDQENLREEWAKLTDDDLDMLSRMEHERWAAPLWLRNYEVGERDDEARRHPNLVSYDDLDIDTQNYDTDQVRRAIDYHQQK
ncbi:MAG: hypothetical protein CMO69_07580 [Verrucomicrobiales bacterium]|nr:hypothetical protein [Verrucomicrobiales bacterium]